MPDDRRRFVMRSGSFSQRAYGALLLVFGLIAIITPFSAGGWAISILGLIVLLAGVVKVIEGLRTQSPSSTGATYLTGVLMLLGEGASGSGIDPKTTLAQKLKEAGYVTRTVGKWHLGAFKEAQPQNVGFERYALFRSLTQRLAGKDEENVWKPGPGRD